MTQANHRSVATVGTQAHDFCHIPHSDQGHTSLLKLIMLHHSSRNILSCSLELYLYNIECTPFTITLKIYPGTQQARAIIKRRHCSSSTSLRSSPRSFHPLQTPGGMALSTASQTTATSGVKARRKNSWKLLKAPLLTPVRAA